MSGLLCLTWNNHYSTFLKLLSNLHMKDLYCDATIVCHRKYYPVHRLVLSTCSYYFEEIFEQAKCQHPYIIVKDIKQKELEALLTYMYKGEVNVSQESLPDLIKAAEWLQIKGLAVPDDESNKSSSYADNGNISSLLSSFSDFKEKQHENNKYSSKFIHETNTLCKTGIHIDTFNGNKTIDQSPLSNENRNNTTDASKYSKDQSFSLELNASDDQISEQNEVIKEEAKESELYSNVNPSMTTIKSENLLSTSPTADCIPSEFAVSSELLSSNQNDSQVPETTFSHFVSVATDLESLPVHSENSDFNCDSSEARRQRLLCSTKKRYTCSFCSHENKTISGMRQHYMFKHSNLEKPYVCESCSYRCFYRGDMLKHRRKHTGEKPFTCSLCPYRATQKHHIENHMRTHTREKPYECQYCTYKAATKYHLNRHLRRHARGNFFGRKCTLKTLTKDFPSLLNHLEET